MPPTKEVEERVVFYFTALTLVLGVLWGLAGVLLDDPLEFHVVLSFCLGGLVAGSVASYSSWLPAFFCICDTGNVSAGGQISDGRKRAGYFDGHIAHRLYARPLSLP